MNKAFMLTAFRSLVFGLCIFVLIALLSSIKIYSPLDVTGFVLGAAVFWYLFETVFLKTMMQKKKPVRKP
jgi:hypothetical protein